MYLISNDTMLAVSKFNKCKICQQKITTPMLVGSYFYTYVFHLLDFDAANMILFDIKYFF